MPNNHDHDIQGRLKSLEDTTAALQEQMRSIQNGLFGTFEQPGALAILRRVATTVDRHAEQLDALRLDRAKIAGIICAVVAIAGLVYKFFLK